MSFWRTDHGEDAISRIRRRAILGACTRDTINASAPAIGHLITSLYDSFEPRVSPISNRYLRRSGLTENPLLYPTEAV